MYYTTNLYKYNEIKYKENENYTCTQYVESQI